MKVGLWKSESWRKTSSVKWKINQTDCCPTCVIKAPLIQLFDVFPREKSGQVYRFHYVSKFAGILKKTHQNETGDYFKQKQNCPFSYKVSFMAIIWSTVPTATQ